jgi:hypothetical protein
MQNRKVFSRLLQIISVLRPRVHYWRCRMKGGIRGKYTAHNNAGTNLVLLSADVAEHFPDDRSVNAALRGLIRVAKMPLRECTERKPRPLHSGSVLC